MLHRPLLAVLALCLALVALPARPPAQPAGETSLTLELYPLDSQTLLYRGQRTEKTEGGQVTVSTTFTTPQGEPVQTSEAVFRAADLTPVSYRQFDLRSGEREEVRREGDRVVLSYRETKADEVDKASLPLRPDMLLTATVVPFIQRHWDALLGGDTVSFVLLVPSRQDSYRFRLVRDDARTDAGGHGLVVRMEPDSWLLRRLVDPMYFMLAADAPHRLLEFQGRSSLKTDDGKNQDLRYVYRYPAQG